MFAKVKTTRNLSEAFGYNEQKVIEGRAECLLAENYLLDLRSLSARDKLDRFEDRNSLHETIQSNVLRISLNFHFGETIPNDKMQFVAKRYMMDMGLDRQPYLGYRHYDSAQPHMHIVSTIIKADGSPIKAGLAFIVKSAQVSRLLEDEFSLVKNKKITALDEEKLKVSSAERVVYGDKSLRQSISNVLYAVIDHYKYTNLAELNALLGLYNVRADPGSETSRMRKFRGLLYHAIDENGKRKGKSIKASAFFLKPTLPNLEQKFALNNSLRQEHRDRVKTAVDWSLAGNPPDWPGFREAMEQEGITVVAQADKKGGPEGIFFVDHETRSVYTGESLGMRYGLESIQSQCAEEQKAAEELEQQLRQRPHFDL